MIRPFSVLWVFLLSCASAFGQSEDDVSALVDRLVDSSGSDAFRIQQELVEIGDPAIQPLLDVAANTELDLYGRSWAALREMGELLEPYIPQIVGLMDSDDRSVRPALRALERAGPLPPDAIPVLAERMNRLANYMDKLAVAEVLGDVGEAAVPALSDQLRRGDPLTRKYATLALGWNGPAARSAAPALIDALRVQGQDIDSLSRAVSALRKVGELSRALPVFLDMLANGAIESRIMAATVLGQWDYSFVEQIVPALIGALDDDDPRLREATVDSLANFSPHSRSALPRLIPLLKDPYTPLREATARALRDFGPYLDGVIPAAIAALGDESELVRQSAADVLANQSADPGLAGAALTRVAVESEWQTQLHARQALQAIDPSGEVVSSYFLDVLSSDDAAHRSTGLQLLAATGHVDADVENEILRLLGDPSPDVRSNAALAMRALEIRSPQAVPALIDLLEDESLPVRINAVSALSLHGADGSGSVPLLIGMLNTESPELLDAVIGTLGAIGPPAADSVEPLLDLLPSANRLVARDIVDSLTSIGPRAFEAVRRLVDADPARGFDATDPALPVSLYNVRLLLQSGYTADQLVALFERQLGHSDSNIVSNAATALEMLAPESAEAVPALLQVSTSNSVSPRARSDARDAAAVISNGALPQPFPILDQLADRPYPFPLPVLIELLDNPEEIGRELAVRSIGLLGEAAESAVPDLIRALSDRSAPVRYYAALSLSVSTIGPRGQEAFEALLAATQDFDVDVRNAARLSLSVSGLDPFGFAPEDIWFQPYHERNRTYTLRDRRDAFTVAWMAGAARFLGPASVGWHLEAIRSGQGFIGVTSIITLGRLDYDDPLIVDMLLDTARNQTQSRQTESIVALGLLGSDAEEALPLLDDFRYHHDREVRLAAKASAEMIRGDDI